MQNFSKLLVVLPCHSLEDFPIHHRGEEAANLLAHWTALWHPALIASAGEKPDWHQADNPDINFEPRFPQGSETDLNPDSDSTPSEQTDQTDLTEATTANDDSPPLCLALIPMVAEPNIDSELRQNLELANAIVIDELSSREQIVEAALKANEHARALADRVDPQIAADFHALGYAFLQVQIMTRQLRYSSNLDESYFSKTVALAAQYATEGNHEQAKLGLTKCYDALLEEKNAYYPVEPELLDVVLTANTTLGKSLARQLQQKHAFNVLMTGLSAQKLANSNVEALQQFKRRLHIGDGDAHKEDAHKEDAHKEDAHKEDAHEDAHKDETETDRPLKVSVIGGLQDELPETLVSTESLINQLEVGRQTIQHLLGVEPTVFMRRRFGLTPEIPGVLDQFDFVGAIHATLDDGKFPLCSGSNIRWTGNDDRSILAFGEAPLSAVDEGAFVGLGVKIGEAIDSAHIAAVVFCHWPGQTCQSFEDLLRITEYSPLFGSFITLEDYFESVYDPGYGDTFTSDEYRDPYLKQAVEKKTPDPISRITRYWRRFYQLNSCRSLLTQLCAKSPIGQAAVGEFQSKIGQLQTAIEVGLNSDLDDPPIDDQIEALSHSLSARWQGQAQAGATSRASQPDQQPQTTLINTTSFKRNVILNPETSLVGSVKSKPPIVFADNTSSGAHWLVELPPMGSIQFSDFTLGKVDVFKSDPNVCDGRILRNEFFELTVDDKTGGIRSIQLYGSRINLAGQQLAIRIPSERDSYNQPLTKARYTTMVADKIESSSQTRLSGSIVSQGLLLDGSEPLAKFKQTISLSRGVRVANVEVEMELLSDLSSSFNHYVCSRLAWKSESSRVIANTQETRHEVTSDWFNATNFIEIAQDDHRLTMLTGGLPYHRRATRRMLDSLLIVGEESQRRFSFGLGVDVAYAMAASVDRMTPPIEVESGSSSASRNESNWMFHFSSKNILATHWEPFFDESDSDSQEWSGVRIRLRETEGRKGKLTIRCPKPIANAERVNFSGDYLTAVVVDKEDPTQLEFEFGRFDYFQISIHWKK